MSRYMYKLSKEAPWGSRTLGRKERSEQSRNRSPVPASSLPPSHVPLTLTSPDVFPQKVAKYVRVLEVYSVSMVTRAWMLDYKGDNMLQ